MEIREKLEELDLMYRRAQMSQAEETLLKWLEEAEEEGDEGARLAIYNEMEGLYRTIGRAKEAVQVSERALRLMEEMRLSGTVSHGTTLLNGATANRAAGNLEEALKLYRQAAEIFRSLGKTDGYEMASLYNNISHIYQAQGSHEQALSYLEQALEMTRRVYGESVDVPGAVPAGGSHDCSDCRDSAGVEEGISGAVSGSGFSGKSSVLGGGYFRGYVF